MNHIYNLSGDKSTIDYIESKLIEYGKSSIVARAKEWLGVEGLTDMLVDYSRDSETQICVSSVTFSSDTKPFVILAEALSEKIDNLIVTYRFFQKNDSISGGYQCEDGIIESQFEFDDRSTLCDAITDYLCALHIGIDNHDRISVDGELISEFLEEVRPCANNPPFVIEKHRILFRDETLVLHLEYNAKEKRQVDGRNFADSYEIYGLTGVSWSRYGYEGETEGLLTELIAGDVATNFTELVPYRFASEISEEYLL